MQHNGMLMHWTKAMNCPPACANLATVVHEPSPNLCNGSVEEVVGFVGSRRRWTCEIERLDRVGRFTGECLESSQTDGPFFCNQGSTKAWFFGADIVRRRVLGNVMGGSSLSSRHGGNCAMRRWSSLEVVTNAQ